MTQAKPIITPARLLFVWPGTWSWPCDGKVSVKADDQKVHDGGIASHESMDSQRSQARFLTPTFMMM